MFTEQVWFLAVAVVGSALSTLKAFGGFKVDTNDKSTAWWAHQLWFNFTGAFVGWAAAWLVGRKVWGCLSSCPVTARPATA